MYFVSIGGVRVKGLIRLPRFFQLTFAARKAALAADGNISVDLFRQGRIFFAVSSWESAAAMKAYAHNGNHLALMRAREALFDFAHNTTIRCEEIPTRAQAKAAWHAAFPAPFES